MVARGVIVFDGDDTLWWAEPLYDDARRLASEVVAASGLNPVAWSTLQQELDLQNVETMGLSAERFPTSCVEAYERLSRTGGVEPDPLVSREIWAAAESVFSRPAPQHPAAGTVLQRVHESFDVALLTKGDPSVQNRRVDESGLAEWFDDVRIVDHKTAGDFKEAVQRLDGDPGSSWSVGNSLVSDIEPALEAGLRAVWIDAHVWPHERRLTIPSTPDVVILDNLSHLPDVLLHTAVDSRRA